MKIKNFNTALFSIFIASGATKTSCTPDNEQTLTDSSNILNNDKYKSGQESCIRDFASDNKNSKIAPEEIHKFSDAVKHINLVEYSLRQFADLFSDVDKKEFRYLMSRILKDPKNFKNSDLEELKDKFKEAFKKIDPKLSDSIRKGFMSLKDFVIQSETPKFYDLFSAIYLAFNGDQNFKSDEELQKALDSFSEKFFDMCAKISPNDIKNLSEKSNKALTEIVQLLSKRGALATILNDKDKDVMNDVLELLQMLSTVNSEMNNEQEIGDEFAKKFEEIINKIKNNIEELEKAKDGAYIVTDPDRLNSYIGDKGVSNNFHAITTDGTSGSKFTIYTNSNYSDATTTEEIDLKDLKKLTVLKNTSNYVNSINELFNLMDRETAGANVGCTEEEFVKCIIGAPLKEYRNVMLSGTKPTTKDELKDYIALLSSNDGKSVDPNYPGGKYLVMASGDTVDYSGGKGFWTSRKYTLDEEKEWLYRWDSTAKKYLDYSTLNGCNISNSVVVKRGDGKKIKINGHDLDQVTVVRNDGRTYIQELVGKDVKDNTGSDITLKARLDNLKKYFDDLNTTETIKNLYGTNDNECIWKILNDEIGRYTSSINITYKDILKLMDMLNEEFRKKIVYVFFWYYYNFDINTNTALYYTEGIYHKLITILGRIDEEVDDAKDIEFDTNPKISIKPNKLFYFYDFSLSNTNVDIAELEPLVYKRSENDLVSFIDLKRTANRLNHYRTIRGTTSPFKSTAASFAMDNCNNFYGRKLDDNLSNIRATKQRAEEDLNKAIEKIKKLGYGKDYSGKDLDADKKADELFISLNNSLNVCCISDLNHDIHMLRKYEFTTLPTAAGKIQAEMTKRHDAYNTFQTSHLDSKVSANVRSIRKMVIDDNRNIEILYKQYLELRNIILGDSKHILEEDYSKLMSTILGNTRMQNFLNTNKTLSTRFRESTIKDGPCILFQESDIDILIGACQTRRDAHELNMSRIFGDVFSGKITEYSNYISEISTSLATNNKTNIKTRIEAAHKVYEAEEKRKADEAAKKAMKP